MTPTPTSVLMRATQHLLVITETFESLLPGFRRPHRNGLRPARRPSPCAGSAHFHSDTVPLKTNGRPDVLGSFMFTCSPMLLQPPHARDR